VIGVVYAVAGWLGGDRAFALGGFALMAGIAVAFLVLRRSSEMVAGLLDRRDERINAIDSQATVFAGMTVITAVIVGFVVEVARGHDGSPYSMLGAIGGVSYVVALVVLRFRR
jgi:Na+/H+ antiporter NhaD/arsenite permease-like protein